MKLLVGTVIFFLGVPLGIVLLPITTVFKVWNRDLGVFWICDWAWERFLR